MLKVSVLLGNCLVLFFFLFFLRISAKKLQIYRAEKMKSISGLFFQQSLKAGLFLLVIIRLPSPSPSTLSCTVYH